MGADVIAPLSIQFCWPTTHWNKIHALFSDFKHKSVNNLLRFRLDELSVIFRPHSVDRFFPPHFMGPFGTEACETPPIPSPPKHLINARADSQSLNFPPYYFSDPKFPLYFTDKKIFASCFLSGVFLRSCVAKFVGPTSLNFGSGAHSWIGIDFVSR